MQRSLYKIVSMSSRQKELVATLQISIERIYSKHHQHIFSFICFYPWNLSDPDFNDDHFERQPPEENLSFSPVYDDSSFKEQKVTSNSSENVMDLL